MYHRERKLECPSCGKRGKFRRYIDRHTDQFLPDHVGICDRENNCGYNYTAKQWLADGGQVENMDQYKVPPPPPKRTDWRCPEKVFRMTHGEDKDGGIIATRNNLIQWMLGTRLDDEPLFAFQEYQVGTYPNGKHYPDLMCSAVFWQIGIDGQPRSGKVVQYDPDTGRRRKDVKATWMHSIITGKSMSEIGCAQVYFGEHLLPKRPDADVCIVESEKTALICSCLFPDYVWLATGGSNALSIEKSMCLSGSRVILFPDKGMYDQWLEKSSDIEPMLEYLHVSDVLEKMDAEEGSDIADYLLPSDVFEERGISLFPERAPVQIEEPKPVDVSLVESPVTRILQRPEVQNLVKALDLDMNKAIIKPYEQ